MLFAESELSLMQPQMPFMERKSSKGLSKAGALMMTNQTSVDVTCDALAALLEDREQSKLARMTANGLITDAELQSHAPRARRVSLAELRVRASALRKLVPHRLTPENLAAMLRCDTDTAESLLDEALVA